MVSMMEILMTSIALVMTGLAIGFIIARYMYARLADYAIQQTLKAQTHAKDALAQTDEALQIAQHERERASLLAAEIQEIMRDEVNSEYGHALALKTALHVRVHGQGEDQ